MLKDLQAGCQVGILDKGGAVPAYRTGTVVRVSPVRYEQRTQAGQFVPPVAERVVDVTVESEGATATYTVPETANVAVSGSLTLSADTGLIANEVRGLLKRSRDIIASVPAHEEAAKACEGILASLNPEYAEGRAQAERVERLERSLAEMGDALGGIREMLSKALNANMNQNNRSKARNVERNEDIQG